MYQLNGSWENTKDVTKFNYDCGYCGKNVGPSKKYECYSGMGTSKTTYGHIYICPNCNKPTYFYKFNEEQTPGPIKGQELSYLPDNVNSLYKEARRCLSVNANTAAVLTCRKILMNTAVEKGANQGRRFAEYVDYLNDHHYIPPDSKRWVDHIRKKGNEANHEIPDMNQDDAEELLLFTEMLLRFVYELPAMMDERSNK